MTNEVSESQLAMSVPEKYREVMLRALEYKNNQNAQNAEWVCEVMSELCALKRQVKEQENILKNLEDVINFAVRNTAKNENTKQFFNVKPSLHVGKVKNPVEMLSRLMQIFDDPMEFSSCIEFNFNHLRDLMGKEFIAENSDIITEKDYAPAVYFKNKE